MLEIRSVHSISVRKPESRDHFRDLVVECDNILTVWGKFGTWGWTVLS